MPVVNGMRQLAASVRLSELLRLGCLSCFSCLLHAHALRHGSEKKTKTKTNKQTNKQTHTHTNKQTNTHTHTPYPFWLKSLRMRGGLSQSGMFLSHLSQSGCGSLSV